MSHWYTDNAESLGCSPRARLTRILDRARATVPDGLQGRFDQAGIAA